MSRLDTLTVKLFADSADLEDIRRARANPLIKGFTTNPTLMRKAGVDDYEVFARQVLEAVGDLPVSLGITADDFPEMVREARTLAGWAPNVNVKIPVTDTHGRFSGPVIHELSHSGIVVNVTAVMTCAQLASVAEALAVDTPAIVSVFAGRIADTGVDPVPTMRAFHQMFAERPNARLLWASPREVLNIFQADEAGCHIVTATADILTKLPLVGKDLEVFSRETVVMFHRDARSSRYEIEPAVA